MMFTKIIWLLLVILAPINSISFTEELDTKWMLFKSFYNKTYDRITEIARRLIWEENVKYIQHHNILYDLRKKSYFLGVNEFSDLTNTEYRRLLIKYDLFESNLTDTKIYKHPSNFKFVDTINWVNEGYVTPVKNQLACGSCWAFSTTGSMEGQYKRRTGKLMSFSEQQLVDCSQKYGNRGCEGGLMNNAFRYIKRFGLELESEYPYTAKNGQCNYKKQGVITHCTGKVIIPRFNETMLMSAVARVGPVSVAIDAGQRSFQLYRGGVYDEPLCSSISLDHGVLVVGYGSLDDKPYWLVKNSWGPNWGDKGYIKMSKDNKNQCGIATQASYPII